MCRSPPVLVMPVQFSLPLRWVRADQTFPSCLKMFRNPPTTAAFAVLAAARCCPLLLLLLLLSLLCHLSSSLLCLCCLQQIAIAFVVIVVSLRCLCLLPGCVPGSFLGFSVFGIGCGVCPSGSRYTECFSCIWSPFVSFLLTLRCIWSEKSF